jgi:hypothetical protein
MRRLAPIGLVVACAVLTACGSEQVIGTASPARTSQAAVSTTTPPPAPASASPYTAAFGDGIHTVGIDVLPGTFATAPEARNCYWGRFDVMGNVIDEAVVPYSASGVTVTIAPTDYKFFSDNCGQWHHVG